MLLGSILTFGQIISFQQNNPSVTFDLYNNYSKAAVQCDTSLNNENVIDLFSGIGLIPFKINTGIGYKISQNTEFNIQYGGVFSPLAFDFDVYSIGMRFCENKSETIYSMSFGAAFPRKTSNYSFDGIAIEGSIGYLMETGIGFYFMPNFKAGAILREKEKSVGIIGIDLIIGWFIK